MHHHFRPGERIECMVGEHLVLAVIESTDEALGVSGS
jgi:hypothetical protein